jgi:hypothetical protein
MELCLVVTREVERGDHLERDGNPIRWSSFQPAQVVQFSPGAANVEARHSGFLGRAIVDFRAGLRFSCRSCPRR